MLIQRKESCTAQTAPALSRGQGAILSVIFVFTAVFTAYLPSLMNGVYGSPDETAQAVVAEELAQHGRAYISDNLVSQFPWLHPRSWVSHGDRIVPVGFLGWSWCVSWFERVFGPNIAPWIGAWLLASSLWPLFLLLRPFGFWPAWWGLVGTLSLPTFLLYLNRGLFPNGPELGLFLWSAWLLQKLSSKKTRGWLNYGLLGALLALTVSVRPVELVWMLPWWLWFGRVACKRHHRPSKTQCVALCCGLIVVAWPLFFLAAQTYGAWYRIGYWLHDAPWPGALALGRVASLGLNPLSWLPFGFHPKTIWWNVYSFCLVWLAPWTLFVSFCSVRWLRIEWRKRRASGHVWSESRVLVGLMLWTLVALLSVYGSGKYMDHVGPGLVTQGNSFLRYLFPLAPLFGLLVAWMFSELHGRARAFLCFGLSCLMLFGLYRVFFGDDEGLFNTRHEWRRYADIRAQALNAPDRPDVVISDRSDKVFFPFTRAVSPRPSKSELRRLIDTTRVRVGLFGRPLSQAERDAWRAAGLQVDDAAGFGRERFSWVTLRQEI